MANDLNLGSSTTRTIRYKTQHNMLASQKAGKDMSVARVYVNNTYSLTDMANQLVQRGCMAKKPDIKYVLDSLSVLIQDLLMEGNAIDVGGLVKLTPVITGVFEKGERFNAAKHAILIKATSGKVLRKVASDSPVEKMGGTSSPTITGVTNTVDFTEDIIYGGGETAELAGKFLNFDPHATDEGLFISCPEYEGDDLTLEVLKSEDDSIKFKVNGAIDNEYSAFLTFKTRGGDKNNEEPTEVKYEVTLKPKPVA